VLPIVHRARFTEWEKMRDLAIVKVDPVGALLFFITLKPRVE